MYIIDLKKTEIITTTKLCFSIDIGIYKPKAISSSFGSSFISLSVGEGGSLSNESSPVFALILWKLLKSLNKDFLLPNLKTLNGLAFFIL